LRLAFDQMDVMSKEFGDQCKDHYFL